MVIDKMKRAIRKTARSFGYDIVPYDPELSEQEKRIIRRVKNYTWASSEALSSLIQATKYVTQNDIKGAIVECGVWRGGCMMCVSLTLMNLGRTDRDLYLFDTFEGMPRPTEMDVSSKGLVASKYFEAGKKTESASRWLYAPLEDVTKSLATTRCDMERIHFVKGLVENTIPKNAPAEIALLRLDTDFYESTKHALVHLYPRLSVGGVIIVDDYGYWLGARKAVDEYISENNIPLLLNKVDYSGSMGVKISLS